MQVRGTKTSTLVGIATAAEVASHKIGAQKKWANHMTLDDYITIPTWMDPMMRMLKPLGFKRRFVFAHAAMIASVACEFLEVEAQGM